MAKNKDNLLKGHLRNALRRQTVAQALSGLRSGNPNDYARCIAAFKAVCPFDAARLFAVGPREVGSLIWTYSSLRPLTLANELSWASGWLRGHARVINGFRTFSNDIQDQVLAGRIQDAAANLDDFCLTHGWSFWAIELRMALEQLANGTESQKLFAMSWQSGSKSGVTKLILQVVSDRNDPTFSYDGFYSKCQDSFPRITAADWIAPYLFYRSMSHVVGNPESSLPIILAREVTSSLVDYYEAVVETLFVIAAGELNNLRMAAVRTLDELLRDGYVDERLNKIRFALTGIVTVSENFPISADVQLLSDATTNTFDWDRLSQPSSDFIRDVLQGIHECDEQGMVAQDAITRLIKLGVNLKSLTCGVALAFSAQRTGDDLSTYAIVPLALTFVDPILHLEDVASLDDATVPIALRSIAERSEQPGTERASELISVLDGGPTTTFKPQHSNLDLWLARWLVHQGRHAESLALCDQIGQQGSYWKRQAAKVRLSCLCSLPDTAASLDLMTDWLIQSSAFAYEFPIERIFAEQEWGTFSTLDSLLVGIVAHHAYIATGDQDIGYICKMACRRFALSGRRDNVVAEFLGASEVEKLHLIHFFREVWIEENLALNHRLESTEAVRRERMEIMQLLMEWDVDNAPLYVDAIKDLTFDETLRKGLRHIDQTRVFVNEAAIYRWAEKELGQDYERWSRLQESSTKAVLIDDLVRQYVVSPSNLPLLLALGLDMPTEADALLIQMIERLFKRFLLDPHEGLDCFLSVRIRHGSLRGTLFGPLEEQGLLYSATGFSRSAFENRWWPILDLSPDEQSGVLAALETFSKRLRAISDELTSERIQVCSDAKPKGGIPSVIEPSFARVLAASLSDRKLSFQSLVYTAFFIFWKSIEPYLAALGAYIRGDVKERVQKEFDELLRTLRDMGHQTMPLVTALRTVATTTQSQCDVIADWFKLPGQSDGHENYKLSVAIEIAKAATKNVHRAFPAVVRLGSMPDEDLPLSTSGLSVLTDCLFVIFENAWKHSGLGEEIGTIDLDARFDHPTRLLEIAVRSNLTDNERATLRAGKLQKIREKHFGADQLELARQEGGSGFAKLGRLTRPVPRMIVAEPMTFGIADDDRWFIRVTIPLYEREGVYEAYE